MAVKRKRHRQCLNDLQIIFSIFFIIWGFIVVFQGYTEEVIKKDYLVTSTYEGVVSSKSEIPYEDINGNRSIHHILTLKTDNEKRDVFVSELEYKKYDKGEVLSFEKDNVGNYHLSNNDLIVVKRHMSAGNFIFGCIMIISPFAVIYYQSENGLLKRHKESYSRRFIRNIFEIKQT